MRAPVPLEVHEVVTESVPAVVTCVTTTTDALAIAAAMTVGFGRLTQYVQRHELEVSGAPRAIYTAYGNHRTTFTLALPIVPSAQPPPPWGAVRVDLLAAFDGWRFVHVGAYDTLPAMYARITQWLLARGVLSSERDWAHLLPMWEEYLGDLVHTPAKRLVTHVYVPRPP